MTEWRGQLALGVVLAKFVELHARLLRVEAQERENRAARLLEVARRATR